MARMYDITSRSLMCMSGSKGLEWNISLKVNPLSSAVASTPSTLPPPHPPSPEHPPQLTQKPLHCFYFLPYLTQILSSTYYSHRLANPPHLSPPWTLSPTLTTSHPLPPSPSCSRYPTRCLDVTSTHGSTTYYYDPSAVHPWTATWLRQ